MFCRYKYSYNRVSKKAIMKYIDDWINLFLKSISLNMAVRHISCDTQSRHKISFFPYEWLQLSWKLSRQLANRFYWFSGTKWWRIYKAISTHHDARSIPVGLINHRNRVHCHFSVSRISLHSKWIYWKYLIYNTLAKWMIRERDFRTFPIRICLHCAMIMHYFHNDDS